MNIQKKQPVESANLLDVIKKLLRSLDNMFYKWSSDVVLEVKDSKTENGDPAKDVKLQTSDEKYIFYMREIPRKDAEGFVDIILKCEDDSHREEFPKVKLESTDAVIRKWLVNTYGPEYDSWTPYDTDTEPEPGEGAENNDTNSSAKITMIKITSATETMVDLVSVESNMGVDDTMDAVLALAGNDEFLGQLPEGTPATYDVCPSGDCFEVSPCETPTVSMQATIESILSPMYTLWGKFMVIGINSIGSGSENLFRSCENYTWEIRSQIVELSKMAVRFGGYAPNPGKMLLPMVDEYIDGTMYTESAGFVEIRKAMQAVIDAMTLYACNFSREDQVIIDQWAHEWQDHCNYTLARMMVKD